MQIFLRLEHGLPNLLKEILSHIRGQYFGVISCNSAKKDFVRVLDPVDPWLDPARQSDREKQFIGKTESISVAMRSRCADMLVLASFHGPRKSIGPLRPSLFAFASMEVKDVGGKMEDTDAQPPWPPEYNHAHHDIVSGQQIVASAMSGISQSDPARVLQYSESSVLAEIARLMQRTDADKRFRKNAAHRFRRLFADGGEWRDTWIEVAKTVPEIMHDDNVIRELRTLWSSDRAEWKRIASQLPQITRDAKYSSGI